MKFPAGALFAGTGTGRLPRSHFTIFSWICRWTLRRQAPHRLWRRYQYLAVAPDGALYPCHQFVGHPEYCLGDLDRGITRPDIQDTVPAVARLFQICLPILLVTVFMRRWLSCPGSPDGRGSGESISSDLQTGPGASGRGLYYLALGHLLGLVKMATE